LGFEITTSVDVLTGLSNAALSWHARRVKMEDTTSKIISCPVKHVHLQRIAIPHSWSVWSALCDNVYIAE